MIPERHGLARTDPKHVERDEFSQGMRRSWSLVRTDRCAIENVATGVAAGTKAPSCWSPSCSYAWALGWGRPASALRFGTRRLRDGSRVPAAHGASSPGAGLRRRESRWRSGSPTVCLGRGTTSRRTTPPHCTRTTSGGSGQPAVTAAISTGRSPSTRPHSTCWWMGAGTFPLVWLPRAPTNDFVQNAHSLYLETLLEDGLVGLALLAAVVVLVIAGAGRAACAAATSRARAAAVCPRRCVACGVAAFTGSGMCRSCALAVLLLGAAALAPDRRRATAARSGRLRWTLRDRRGRGSPSRRWWRSRFHSATERRRQSHRGGFTAILPRLSRTRRRQLRSSQGQRLPSSRKSLVLELQDRVAEARDRRRARPPATSPSQRIAWFVRRAWRPGRSSGRRLPHFAVPAR